MLRNTALKLENITKIFQSIVPVGMYQLNEIFVIPIVKFFTHLHCLSEN